MFIGSKALLQTTPHLKEKKRLNPNTNGQTPTPTAKPQHPRPNHNTNTKYPSEFPNQKSTNAHLFSIGPFHFGWIHYQGREATMGLLRQNKVELVDLTVVDVILKKSFPMLETDTLS